MLLLTRCVSLPVQRAPLPSLLRRSRPTMTWSPWRLIACRHLLSRGVLRQPVRAVLVLLMAHPQPHSTRRLQRPVRELAPLPLQLIIARMLP
jgi:hypothetical protein